MCQTHSRRSRAEDQKCKLQMNPSNLPFPRFLRSSHDVSVYFNPTSTGQQVVHARAHVFILSDLFLVAEWMEAVDKAAKAQQVAREQPERVGQGGPMPEMWLSYPPLAGKHLIVAEGNQCRFEFSYSVPANLSSKRSHSDYHAKRNIHHPRGIRNGTRPNDEGSAGLYRLRWEW